MLESADRKYLYVRQRKKKERQTRRILTKPITVVPRNLFNRRFRGDNAGILASNNEEGRERICGAKRNGIYRRWITGKEWHDNATLLARAWNERMHREMRLRTASSTRQSCFAPPRRCRHYTKLYLSCPLICTLWIRTYLLSLNLAALNTLDH